MTEERERIAYLLYKACRPFITPDPLPKTPWKPTGDFLAMAQAVIEDRRQWPSCGHIATSVCFACYVDRGHELDLVTAERDALKARCEELAERIVDADALHLADEQGIRNLEARIAELEAQVSRRVAEVVEQCRGCHLCAPAPEPADGCPSCPRCEEITRAVVGAPVRCLAHHGVVEDRG